MLHTATPDDIKAYQQQVEKNKITPESLPDCPRCNVYSTYFKVHAYRERRFLIIVETIITAVFCSLVRFKCPGCGKTLTFYPDFALPNKHYTKDAVAGFAGAYLQHDRLTYQKAVMVENQLPVYPNSQDSGKSLAPSTIHRWVSTLASFETTARKALDLILQQNPASSICRDLAQIRMPAEKFRSQARKKILIGAVGLVLTEALFQATFTVSIFTKLARRCAFT
jgi:hypothetical protein